MSSDNFEVHSAGTGTELRLSRALANSIEQLEAQFPRTVPEPILRAYAPLKAHYQKSLEVTS